VFRSLDFSLGIVAQWVGQFALFGTLFLVPLFLQQARGYGAFDTGLHPRPVGATSAPPYDMAVRLAHELHAALNGAVAAAFNDTFRVMIVAAVAGAVLGLALALRHRQAMPAAVEDNAAAGTGAAPAAA